MAPSTAENRSIFDLDCELETLFDQIQEAAEIGPIPNELQERFLNFCDAFGEKVDRIGRFLRVQEAKAEFAKEEIKRLQDRARCAETKARSTKEMLLYFMNVRGLKKLEGKTHTLRMQANSQDTVRVENPNALPMGYRRVELRIDGKLFADVLELLSREKRELFLQGLKEFQPNNDAIHEANLRKEEIPGVTIYRGHHIRVA